MSSFETVRERGKNLLIYGGITAMAGAAMLGVGGSAFAQDSTPTAGTEASTPAADTTTDPWAARQAEQDAFLDALAANLGVADGATVEAAIKTTMKQLVDERLAAGEISADDAEAIKAAIDSGDYPVGLHLPGLGGMGGPGGFDWPGDFDGPGMDGPGDFYGPGHRGADDRVGPGGTVRDDGDTGDDPTDDATDDTLAPGTGTPTAGATA